MIFPARSQTNVGRGLPFREAHEVSAKLVANCISQKKTFEDLSLEDWKSVSPLIEPDVLEAVDIRNVLARRQSEGAPAPECVREQMDILIQVLAK